MKFQLILLFVVLFISSACTSLQPIEMPPEELQRRITSEYILQPGTRAKIVTTDGVIHKVKVTRVNLDSGVIETKSKPVPIADVVAVETRDFSLGKTALLAAGTYTFLVLTAMAVAPVLIL